MSQAAGNFAALKDPGFRHFVLLSAGAMLADNVEHVITYYAAFRRFHSPTLGGFAVISHWVPYLILSIPVGVLTDRVDPRRLVQAGMLLFIGVSAAWGTLILTDTLQIWHAEVLLVLHGVAGVFWLAPSQVLLYAGPSLGLYINAMIYVPFLLWLVTAPYGRDSTAGIGAVKSRLRGIADVIATLRAVRDNRILIAMMLLSGSAALLIGGAYQAQMPQFAQDLRVGDAGVTYAVLLAADACGALLGGVLLEMRGGLRSRPVTAVAQAMLWCVALAGFALSGSYLPAVACLFAAGFLELAFNSMSQALIQLNAPDAIRGRVLGVYSMASLGARTFSGVSVGLLGGLIGVHQSLALSAVVLLSGLALLWRVCSRGHLG